MLIQVSNIWPVVQITRKVGRMIRQRSYGFGAIRIPVSRYTAVVVVTAAAREIRCLSRNDRYPQPTLTGFRLIGSSECALKRIVGRRFLGFDVSALSHLYDPSG